MKKNQTTCGCGKAVRKEPFVIGNDVSILACSKKCAMKFGNQAINIADRITKKEK